MKRPLYGTIFASFILIMSLIGCGYHMTPEFYTVKYQVSGTAKNVTINAVTDEHGTVQIYSNVSLPWELTYENTTQDMFPSIYLKVEVTATPTAIDTGTADTASAGHLVNSIADFVTAGVGVGDVALNPGSGNYSAITNVTAADLTLTPGDNPFPLGTENYEIYAMGSLTGKAYGDEELLESLNLQSWTIMGATIIARNYTAP